MPYAARDETQVGAVGARQEKRSPVSLKIKFKSESVDEFIERYSVDVSQGGMFIRTRKPLEVSTSLSFEFTLQDGSPLLAGDGTVVWTREHDPSRATLAPGMGVRFDRLLSGGQSVLDRILRAKQEERDAAASGNLGQDEPAPDAATSTTGEPSELADPQSLEEQLAAAAESLAAGWSGPLGQEGSDPPLLPDDVPFDGPVAEEAAQEEAPRAADVFDELAAGPDDELASETPAEPTQIDEQAATADSADAPALILPDFDDAPILPPDPEEQEEEAYEAPDVIGAKIDQPKIVKAKLETPKKAPKAARKEASHSAVRAESKPRKKALRQPRSAKPIIVAGGLLFAAGTLAGVYSLLEARGKVAAGGAGSKAGSTLGPAVAGAMVQEHEATRDAGPPDAETMIQRVRVMVTSDPPGALLIIDGTAYPQATPTSLAIEAGKSHKIVARLPCHEERQQDLLVGPEEEQRSLSFALPKLPRVVEISSEPSGAAIVVDGKARGTSPAEVKFEGDKELAAVHTIELKLAGYEPISTEMTPEDPCKNDHAAAVLALHHRLRSLAPPPKPKPALAAPRRRARRDVPSGGTDERVPAWVNQAVTQ